jgi:hypothetical protein
VTTEGENLAHTGELSEQPQRPPEPPTYIRGPLRPSHLRTVRARSARRLASHAFRAADATFLTALTVAILVWSSPQSMLN